jgi:hypothetical protein
MGIDPLPRKCLLYFAMPSLLPGPALELRDEVAARDGLDRDRDVSVEHEGIPPRNSVLRCAAVDVGLD